MVENINEGQISCSTVSSDSALIKIKNHQFAVDYSTLMDLLTELAVVASHMEHNCPYLGNEQGLQRPCRREMH